MKKNKFLIIILAVALLLCLIPNVFSLFGIPDILRSAMNIVSYPVRIALNFSVDGVMGLDEYFRSLDSLKKENEELKKELDEMSDYKNQAESLRSENDALRKHLNAEAVIADYKVKDARIIGRTSNSYSVTYTLNRGSESGIKVNMAVITADGVCGYIKEVGIGYCRVAALTDPTAAVGVSTAGGIYGTVEGSVAYRNDGLCIMDSDITGLDNGTVLYSNGFGNTFPPMLPVGKIIDCQKNEYSHIVTYIVQPFIDLDGITDVMIVTEKTATLSAPDTEEPPVSDSEGEVNDK